jgi:hypothetical protein
MTEVMPSQVVYGRIEVMPSLAENARIAPC